MIIMIAMIVIDMVQMIVVNIVMIVVVSHNIKVVSMSLQITFGPILA